MGNGRKIDLCALTPTVDKVFRLTRKAYIFAIYANPNKPFGINKRHDSELSNTDGLSINVIDAGQCIQAVIIKNAQMPDLNKEISDLPEGGSGSALVDVPCSNFHAKRHISSNTLRLYF